MVEAETTDADNEESEREIEYMPPRGIPLLDEPDDWPDRTYPQFEGKNLTRGWLSEFMPQKDDDEDEEFSDFDEKIRKIEALEEKKRRQTLQAKKAASVKPSSMQKTIRDPLTKKPAQGLSSRSAASALSSATKPALGKPTKAAAPSALASKKLVNSTVAPGNPRHTAARVASNSTLGYSKGRAVSASARAPLVGTFRKPMPSDENQNLFAKAPVKSIDELFDLSDLLKDAAPVNINAVTAEEDEEEECFQLKFPED